MLESGRLPQARTLSRTVNCDVHHLSGLLNVVLWGDRYTH